MGALFEVERASRCESPQKLIAACGRYVSMIPTSKAPSALSSSASAWEFGQSPREPTVPVIAWCTGLQF